MGTLCNFKDLLGQQFGGLTVLSRAENSNAGQCRWSCVCKCGRLCVVASNNLRRGLQVSCGCHRSAIRFKHGLAVRGDEANEYRIWIGIKARCYSKNNKHYHNYGGRGIKMCKRWFHNVELFLADMGKRPTKKHSVERIDNNGHYTPKNCKWALDAEQSMNKRSNVLVTYNGITKPLTFWARKYNINYRKLSYRIQNGWELYRAFIT